MNSARDSRSADPVAPSRDRALELKRLAYKLAGETGLDHRTCRRALERGSGAVHAVADQLLVEEGAKRLNIHLPLPVR